MLGEATGGFLEKKVFLKITILKVAIKILTSSNAFFKNFNRKLERLFFKRGFSSLLLLCVYSIFTIRAGELSWDYGKPINNHLKHEKERHCMEKSPLFCAGKS